MPQISQLSAYYYVGFHEVEHNMSLISIITVIKIDKSVLFTGTVAVVLTKISCSTVKMVFTSHTFNSVGLLLATQR